MLDESVVSFSDLWKSFLAFENVSRKRGERLDAFRERWQENMILARSQGCQYPDELLACKLLQKASLNDIIVNNIVDSIISTKSDILHTLLCKLEQLSSKASEPDKSDQESAEHFGPSEDDCLVKKSDSTFKSRSLVEKLLLLEVKEEAVKDPLTVQGDLSKEDDFSNIADDENTFGKVTNNDYEDDAYHAKDPLQIKEEHASNIFEPELVLMDHGHGQEDTGFLAKDTRKIEHFVNVDNLETHSMVEVKHKNCEPLSSSVHVDLSTSEEPIEVTEIEIKDESINVITPAVESTANNFDAVSIDVINTPSAQQEPDALKQSVEIEVFETSGEDNPKESRLLHIDGPPFHCPMCDFITLYKISIVNHVRMHTGDRPFKCQACPKAFADKYKLKDHYRRAHTDDRPHECTKCNFKALQRHELAKHMKTHRRGRPYKCAFCVKKFKSDKMMRHHIKCQHPDQAMSKDISNNPFKCMYCDAVFEVEPLLKDHIKIQHRRTHEKKVSQCPDCSYKTVWKTRLIAHIRTHTGEKPFKCQLCPKAFTVKAILLIHFRRHHREECTFNCTQCDFGALEQNELTRHMLTHSEGPAFTCPYCDKAFVFKGSLNRHISVMHKRKDGQLTNGPPPHKCPHCEHTTRHKRDIDVHIRTHTGEKPYSCPNCQRAFASKGLLDLHFRRVHSKERPFKCNQCNFAALRQYQLKRHMFVHSGGPSFKCSICEKAFMFKDSLDTHLRNQHPENSQDARSQCELCGCSYKRDYISKHRANCLRKSEKIKLEPEKKIVKRVAGPSQCEHCGNNFASRNGLKEHYTNCPNLDETERKTKGYQKPPRKKFACKICNKIVTKLNFRHHMTLHSGKRDIKCDLCPKKFTHHYYLEKHKKRHEERKFQCEVCAKSFVGSGELKIHFMRDHTSERPFKCPHCTFCTVNGSNLKAHIIRRHTKETPFKCDQCGKGFKENYSLQRHMKNLHKHREELHIITVKEDEI